MKFIERFENWMLPKSERNPAQEARSAIEKPLDTTSSARALYTATDTTDVMKLPSVWAAVSLISEQIAAMPTMLLKREGNKWVKVEDKARLRILRRPAPGWTEFEFCRHLMASMLTEGAGVSIVEREKNNNLKNSVPADASKVERSIKGTTISYKINGVNFLASEIVDLRWKRMPDGQTPVNPRQVLSDTFNSMLLTKKFAHRSFLTGGLPIQALIVSADSTPEAMDRAKADMNERFKAFGGGTEDTATPESQLVVLPAGVDIKSIGQSMEDLQYIEIQHFMTEETARIYGLPGAFLEIKQPSAPQAEQQGLRLLRALVPYMTLYEETLSAVYWPSGDYKIQKDPIALMRADTKALVEALTKAVQGGLLTPNEARSRSWEALSPVEDESADKLYVQQQMVPLDRAGHVEAEPVEENENDEESPDDE